MNRDQTLFSLEKDRIVSTDDQWRLIEIQLANWGTFDQQIYRIPISREGHLFTGSSGSGKSTLLDGVAAVLTPDKWLRFNQAAQGTGNRHGQRSPISYVRGAWVRTADTQEDRLVTQYLRPKATWSGLLLRFEKRGEKPVSLARLFFVKGTSTNRADLASVRILDRSLLDLHDLEGFARGGLQTRAIKAALPQATVTSTSSHQSFFTKMTSVFGMKSDSALQLLHKTQSTKNLGGLDQLFRDYMLDVPSTLTMADDAIEQFGQLSDAHHQVTELRKQRDHLVKVRDAVADFESAQEKLHYLETLSDNLRSYLVQESLRLGKTDLEKAELNLAAALEETTAANEHYEQSDHVFQSAQRRNIEAGGADVAHLEERIHESVAYAEATAQRFESFTRELADAGIREIPRCEADFVELQAAIATLLESTTTPQGPSHQELDQAMQGRRLVDRLNKEMRLIHRSGSTIPLRLQHARKLISEGTGIPEMSLPFAAELIEVEPEYEAWTGAIERVLRPLGLTMLVRSENLIQVRRFVDDNHLAVRLVYEEVGLEAPDMRPTRSALSLVHRIRVKEGAHRDWLNGILSQRFDFACVDTANELENFTQALTVNGQVKSSRTKYIKDDRKSINDRSEWILGDLADKLEVLSEKLQVAELELREAEEIVLKAQVMRDESQKQQGMLRGLQQRSWADLDVTAAESKTRALRDQYDVLCNGSGEIKSTMQALEIARSDRLLAEERRSIARDRFVACQRDREVLSAELHELRVENLEPVPPEVERAITERIHAARRSVTRKQLPHIMQSVHGQIQGEERQARTLETAARDTIATLVTQFKEYWRGVADDLTTSVTDRHGYIEILNDIVARGLPDHEKRFLTMLRDRSRDLVSELLSEIRGAPREVVERIDPINESLRRSEFDRDRYLRLRVKTRRPTVAIEFLEDLRSIIDESWGDANMENAEIRFATLRRLMTDLASSDPRMREWRTQCLDTRLHVSFIAEEIDVSGNTYASYDSGSALSGGQQQKLVFFCLAAALRYQLTDAEEVFPQYATVILDEAFDRADFHYTKIALNIFREFGLHLVLATPHKLLQTIEPYIGGATEIENPTRDHSQVANVMWQESTP